MFSPNSGQRAISLRSPARSKTIVSVGSTATHALSVGSPVNIAMSPRYVPPSACRDHDVLAGLAIDELDEAAHEHVEGRLAHRVLVEHLAGLERPPLAALGEPLELRVREPREHDLVVEVGKPLAPNDLGGSHATEATPLQASKGFPFPFRVLTGGGNPSIMNPSRIAKSAHRRRHPDRLPGVRRQRLGRRRARRGYGFCHLDQHPGTHASPERSIRTAYPTSWYFVYGTTTAYGSRTASQSVGSGTHAVDVSVSISRLAATTGYHFQLIASNAVGNEGRRRSSPLPRSEPRAFRPEPSSR